MFIKDRNGKELEVCHIGIHTPKCPCFGDPPLHEIEAARKWLQTVGRAYEIRGLGRTALSSYSGKHIVEGLLHSYISNGAFIVASYQEKFEQKVTAIPNTDVNISTKADHRWDKRTKLVEFLTGQPCRMC